MADGIASPTPPVPSAGPAGASMPAPTTTLHVTPMTLPRGQVLHRIHDEAFAGDAFNPGLAGNARFSPIQTADGRPIPTLYAAATFEAAAMESVFHDVPHAPGLKAYDKRRLRRQVHSRVALGQDLRLADFTSKPLRKLGVSRRQLIDTEKDQYPATRAWAAAVHLQQPDLQGLYWTSRQDDAAFAVVLFGDRVPPQALHSLEAPRSLLGDERAHAELLDLADVIGVSVVPGRTP